MIVAIILMVVGGFFSNLVHTGGGKISKHKVHYVTEFGTTMAGLLYVPETATPTNKVPAIVVAHGFTGTIPSMYAVTLEMARQGYVVLSIEMLEHGHSSGPYEHIAPWRGMHAYSALQYLGKLPYVDVANIGMYGHSFGAVEVQFATRKAVKNSESDPTVIVPKAFFNGANNPKIMDDESAGVLDLDWATINGTEDEFRFFFDPTHKTAVYMMGFSGAEYNKYYVYNENTSLSREEAIEAVERGEPLRAIFSYPGIHVMAHYSSMVNDYILDFFNISLNSGTAPTPKSGQTWFIRDIFSGFVLAGFLLFLITFILVMLETKYFKSIVNPEPLAPIAWDNSKSKAIYWGLFAFAVLITANLFFWAAGFFWQNRLSGGLMPTLIMPSNYFQQPAANSITAFNLIIGSILLVMFLLTYFLSMKKNGITVDNLGLKITKNTLGKTILLALIAFLSGYLLLSTVYFLFSTDARFFEFAFSPMTPRRFWIMLKYLPFFLYFFIISSLVNNSFTRVRGKSDALNMFLVVISSVGGLLLLWLLDYLLSLAAGPNVRIFSPLPEWWFPGKGQVGLQEILLLPMLFIGIVSAVYSRIIFKKTGSIWLGGIFNALLVTFYVVCHQMVAAGNL